jgi:hypothetical protein
MLTAADLPTERFADHEALSDAVRVNADYAKLVTYNAAVRATDHWVELLAIGPTLWLDLLRQAHETARRL